MVGLYILFCVGLAIYSVDEDVNEIIVMNN